MSDFYRGWAKIVLIHDELSDWLKEQGRHPSELFNGLAVASKSVSRCDAIIEARKESLEKAWESWNIVPHVRQELINGKCVTTVIE